MAVKLKEIAELARVSESTVSRALRNSPLISDKTRGAVLDAARALRYQAARARLVGVIEPKMTNPVYSEILNAIETRVYEAGFGMVLCNSAFDLGRERDQLDFLLRQSEVQGIILIPIDPEAAHIRALIDQNLPCVLLGTDPIAGADQVNVNAALGACTMTSHLLELGHRRIGLITGPGHISACRARLEGYCQALARCQIPFDPALIGQGEVDENGGAAAMGQLLPLVPDEISAVVAIADLMALGALRRLHEAGFRVPDDLSLASCDDIPVAAQIQPALTTLWQPKQELGALAAKLLLKQIETRKERGEGWKTLYPFQSALYQPHIVVRESTRSPALVRDCSAP
jgi:LacI family transcriptional regulator